MESLSKEKNLIVGLLLGMAIAIAIPYAQPSELGASEEVTDEMEELSDDVVRRVLRCMNTGSRLSGTLDLGTVDLRLSTTGFCR